MFRLIPSWQSRNRPENKMREEEKKKNREEEEKKMKPTYLENNLCAKIHSIVQRRSLPSDNYVFTTSLSIIALMGCQGKD